ncbi:MAG: hypothetical protein J6T86_00370 [Bacteroidales bacterium]|nr:hypothetical protein [Bacteroidales bacterium]
MNAFSLITSAVILHIPGSFAKENIRKIKSIRKSDNNRADDLVYSAGESKKLLFSSIICYVLGLCVALIPLLIAIPLRWYWVVLINTAFAVLVSPWFAFLFAPQMYIYRPNELLKTAVVCACISVIAFVLGIVKLTELLTFLILVGTVVWVISYILFTRRFRFNVVIRDVVAETIDISAHDYWMRMASALIITQRYKDAYACLNQQLNRGNSADELNMISKTMDFCVSPLPWRHKLQNHNGSYWHDFLLRRLGRARYNFLTERDVELANQRMTDKTNYDSLVEKLSQS